MKSSKVIQGAQQKLVLDFFEQNSTRYAQNYSKKTSAFHAYFFTERIIDATKDIDFNFRKILDIGAGTGGLYDFLSSHYPSLDYVATDISPNMLVQSNIPAMNQRVGDLSDLELPANSFDFVFMLGVSTYLDKAHLEEYLRTIHKLLKPEGQVIISFTHQHSLDYKIRTLLHPLIKAIKQGNTVIQQNFRIHAYGEAELVELLPKHSFKIEAIKWQNQTITPFNQLTPTIAIRVARLLKKWRSSKLLPYLSADFMVFAAK